MKIPSSLISFTPNQKSARTTEQKQISDHYHRYANKNPRSHTNTHTVQCCVHNLGAENNARSSTKWYLATVGNALQSNLAAFSTDNPDGKDQLNRNRVALRYIFRLVFFRVSILVLRAHSCCRFAAKSLGFVFAFVPLFVESFDTVVDWTIFEWVRWSAVSISLRIFDSKPYPTRCTIRLNIFDYGCFRCWTGELITYEREFNPMFRWFHHIKINRLIHTFSCGPRPRPICLCRSMRVSVKVQFHFRMNNARQNH